MSTITFDFRHHYQRGERRESEQIAYQWDLGHVMEVFVPEDATYTIGYCFGDYEKTEDYAIDTKVQDPDGGYKLTAHIPNKYFERNGELRVYVVGSADDHIITTYEGFITIRGRLMPDDYVDDDPENGATQIIEVAREYATKSESFAVGGTGTRIGEDTDNAKYYLEQAEEVAESIPEDYSELSDDVDQLKNALTTKGEQDGAYPDLTAGQMLSKNEASDSVPYNFRAVGQEATLEYTDAIVGGSVVWNQLESDTWHITGGTKTENIDGTCTFTANASGQQVYKITDVLAHKLFAMSVFKTNSATTDVGMRLFGKNYYGNATTDWQTRSAIVAGYNGGVSVGIVDSRASEWDAITVKYIILSDLTQMFDTTIADYIYTLETATEGSGVAWLKKHFPKMFEYQEYNAGEIVSVQGLSQHVTVGFNQWDEEWEDGGISDATGSDETDYTAWRSKNYIGILPNTVYYAQSSSVNKPIRARFYDANKNYIGATAQGGYVMTGGTFTTPDNAYYMRISPAKSNIPNHDICINLSDPTRNGEYEPYVKRIYPLDDSLTLRGIMKLDSNNQLYADGDRYLSDGTVQRRYGVVDLGTLNWEYNSGRAYFNSTTALSNGKQTLNAISAIYPEIFTSWNAFTGYTDGNALYIDSGNPKVYIKNPSYTDAATFKAAMSGVYLVYELATPTTETAALYTVPQIVDPDGTEEYVSTSIVPVGHESRYPLDIAGRLDKILTMPTANGTYTLRATVNNGAVSYAWVST